MEQVLVQTSIGSRSWEALTAPRFKPFAGQLQSDLNILSVLLRVLEELTEHTVLVRVQASFDIASHLLKVINHMLRHFVLEYFRTVVAEVIKRWAQALLGNVKKIFVPVDTQALGRVP
jgi:hypothetical protein